MVRPDESGELEASMQCRRNWQLRWAGIALAFANVGICYLVPIDLPGDGAQFISALAFSPDGKTLVACYGYPKRAGLARFWDLATRREAAARIEADGPGNFFGVMAFSPEGKRLALGSIGSWIRLVELRSHGTMQLEGHSGWVDALAFSSDGRVLAAGTGDGTIQLWRAASDADVVARGR